MKSSSQVCRVCTREFSKYTCPRCNLPYCNLACYKAHDEECTEAFARDSINEALKNREVSVDDKRAILASLQRLNKDRAEDEEKLRDNAEDAGGDEEQLQRLMLLAAEDRLSLDDLTDAQRKDFFRAVGNGTLSQFVAPWYPWWLPPRPSDLTGEEEDADEDGGDTLDEESFLDEKESPIAKLEKLVQSGMKLDDDGGGDGSRSAGSEESDADGIMPTNWRSRQPRKPLVVSDEDLARPGVPALPDKVPTFSKISPSKPSPLLYYNVIDLLFSYTFSLRRFNGEVSQDSVLVALQLSSVLSRGGVHDTALVAINAVLENVAKLSIEAPPDLSFESMRDVSVILYRPQFITRALSDLRRMIKRLKSRTKKFQESVAPASSTENTAAAARIKELTAVLRKLDFYTSWSHHEASAEVLDKVADEVSTRWLVEMGKLEQRRAAGLPKSPLNVLS